MKDKEWLKEAIFEKAWEENRSEYLIDLDSVNILLDQLEEPKKTVVPLCVAKWFETYKDHLCVSIKGLIYSSNHGSKGSMEKWYLNTPDAILILSDMRYGYEVEKEKLYEVVLIKDVSGERNILMSGGHYFIEWESENEGHYEQRFTEKEIKDYDERFWLFSEEVTE